jgi:hypothetical protein
MEDLKFGTHLQCYLKLNECCHYEKIILAIFFSLSILMSHPHELPCDYYPFYNILCYLLFYIYFIWIC